MSPAHAHLPCTIPNTNNTNSSYLNPIARTTTPRPTLNKIAALVADTSVPEKPGQAGDQMDQPVGIGEPMVQGLGVRDEAETRQSFLHFSRIQTHGHGLQMLLGDLQ